MNCMCLSYKASKHGGKAWQEPTGAARQLWPIYGPARRPTSAPTRIATDGSGRPSRRSPSVLASRSWPSFMMPPSRVLTPWPGFAALLDRIEANGVRTVIVEDASRFDPGVGHHPLDQPRGAAADGPRRRSDGQRRPDAEDDAPDRGRVRRIREGPSGLQAAPRPRARSTREGEVWRAHVELRPEAVALAKRLHRASPKTGKRMSLRKIAATLAEAGHLNERG